MKLKHISLLLSALLLMFSSQLFAQSKLRIEGEAIRDNNAIIPKSKVDINGQQVAGLKILTDLSGLSFDSPNGIVEVQSQPGLYMVFVSPNERKLTIAHPEYVPISFIFTDIGVRLRSGSVFTLTITADKELREIPVNFLIKPEESDVIVLVDDVPVSTTKNLLLEEGKHKVEIAKNGFNPLSKEIEVSLSKTFFEFELTKRELQPVNIFSSPQGAFVFINNENKGQTDKGIYLYPDKYTLRLSLSGYLDVVEEIQVNPNGNNTFKFDLKKNRGFLNLSLSPSNAQVMLNNEAVSISEQMEVIPGDYLLTVKAPGYESYSETIQIRTSEQTNKTISLIPQKGSLQFQINPLSATTKLLEGGSNTVVTSWTGINTLRDLRVGIYTIVSEAENYKPQEKIISIKHNQETSVSLMLEEETGLKGIYEQFVADNKEGENFRWKSFNDTAPWEGNGVTLSDLDLYKELFYARSKKPKEEKGGIFKKAEEVNPELFSLNGFDWINPNPSDGFLGVGFAHPHEKINEAQSFATLAAQINLNTNYSSKVQSLQKLQYKDDYSSESFTQTTQITSNNQNALVGKEQFSFQFVDGSVMSIVSFPLPRKEAANGDNSNQKFRFLAKYFGEDIASNDISIATTSLMVATIHLSDSLHIESVYSDSSNGNLPDISLAIPNRAKVEPEKFETPKWKNEQEKSQFEIENIPKWFIMPPADNVENLFTVCEVRFDPIGKKGIQISDAFFQAKLQASVQMASKLSIKMEALEKAFSAEVEKPADNQNYAEAFTNSNQEIVSQSLQYLQTQKISIRHNGDGLCSMYLLMSLPIGDKRIELENAFSTDDELYSKFKNSKAFKELQQKLDADNKKALEKVNGNN